MPETESVEDFILKMNKRARAGAYDRPEALVELAEKAAAGDPRAQSMMDMHRQLDLNRTIEVSAARREENENS